MLTSFINKDETKRPTDKAVVNALNLGMFSLLVLFWVGITKSKPCQQGPYKLVDNNETKNYERKYPVEHAKDIHH